MTCLKFSIERGLLGFVKTRAVFRPIFLLLREELEEDVLRVVMSSLFSQYLIIAIERKKKKFYEVFTIRSSLIWLKQWVVSKITVVGSSPAFGFYLLNYFIGGLKKSSAFRGNGTYEV